MTKQSEGGWKLWAGVGVATGLFAFLFSPRKAQAMTTSNRGPSDPPSGPAPAASATYTAAQYAPNDPATVLLFQSAARFVGAPIEWATAFGPLHRLLEKESDGWVGRPNYQFGSLATIANHSRWPEVWAAIQDGSWRSLILPQYASSPSSATGLGQLTVTNISTGKYYPSGVMGIGKPLEEAIGMLRYIIERYKTPTAALSFHNKNNWY